MFFRTKTVKGTPLVQLAESFRNAEGQPRQRVVASLGDADIPESEKKLIARAVEKHLCGQAELLDRGLLEEAASWVTRILQVIGRSKSARPARTDKVDEVLVDHIATENVGQFGPQLVARAAWRELGLDGILGDAGLNAVQTATAQLLVAKRLIEPLSEWALIDWTERTALPELLDIRITKTTKDRLYHTGDALFAKRKFIESDLRDAQAGNIFIWVLTCHLLCWVREKLREGGYPRDWKTLRRLLSTHSLATTRLPLEDGRVLHIRKATLPDAGQAQGYQKLGIDWKAEFPPQKRFVKS